jgi:hypothetical protein
MESDIALLHFLYLLPNHGERDLQLIMIKVQGNIKPMPDELLPACVTFGEDYNLLKIIEVPDGR